MKARISAVAVAAVFLFATAVTAQVRPAAPQAQPVETGPPAPPGNFTRNVEPEKQIEIRTNPPAATVQEPTTVELPPPPPPPAPPVIEMQTTTTAEVELPEELPGSGSHYPSLAIAGVALLAGAALLRRRTSA